MLFTSALFVWAYLPLTVLGFFLLGRWSMKMAAAWLFLASVAFYSVWMPEFTLLLMASIVTNYAIGVRIGATRSKHWMVLGVTANLLLLGYFKYANFFVDNLNLLLERSWSLGNVALPLGISFFTFTQIAFLVDAWRKGVREPSFIHYGLFVTYFPHLVAGPVLHHAQMMPQFAQPSTYRFNVENFALGMVIFSLGLIKKVVFADGISPYADSVFDGAEAGSAPSPEEAWLGALAYALQLYFDFSGYSDMAVGLSWMLNIKLPFNFNSPYLATNISEFWRRWHMSLSSFLRDYLYIALGGNRRGEPRRYVNLLLTMVLGGLWHGASWSFVLWGFLHGLYLVLQQLWARVFGGTKERTPEHARQAGSLRFAPRRLLSWLLTMTAVLVAWVLFRSPTLEGALSIYRSMLGHGGDPVNGLFWNEGLNASTGWMWCAMLGTIALWPRNTNQLGLQLRSLVAGRSPWVMGLCGASVTLITLLILMNNSRGPVGAFIYFNF